MLKVRISFRRRFRGRVRSRRIDSMRSRRGRSPASHGSPSSSGSGVSRSKKSNGSRDPNSSALAAGQEAERLISRNGPYSSANRGCSRQVRLVASCPRQRWISHRFSSSRNGHRPPWSGKQKSLLPHLQSDRSLSPKVRERHHTAGRSPRPPRPPTPHSSCAGRPPPGSESGQNNPEHAQAYAFLLSRRKFSTPL